LSHRERLLIRAEVLLRPYTSKRNKYNEGVSMEAISMIRKVTKDGISLRNPKFRKYINQRVKLDITINPLEEPNHPNKCILDLVGAFDDETAKEFYEALDECRQINYETWK
jgi:hypothetical protein